MSGGGRPQRGTARLECRGADGRGGIHGSPDPDVSPARSRRGADPRRLGRAGVSGSPACRLLSGDRSPDRGVPGAGIRVFVDPATGQLRRPTSEERQRIALSSRDRSGKTYDVLVRPDGTRIVKLDETFLMSVVATVNPDGTTSYSCRKGSVRPTDECPAEDPQ